MSTQYLDLVTGRPLVYQDYSQMNERAFERFVLETQRTVSELKEKVERYEDDIERLEDKVEDLEAQVYPDD